MQILIDDDTFHKWALERGYVLLSDIGRQWVEANNWDVTKPPRPTQQQSTTLAEMTSAKWAAELREQPDDLKPVPDVEALRAALRGALARDKEAALTLLNKYGATAISGVQEKDRSRFIAEAEELARSES